MYKFHHFWVNSFAGKEFNTVGFSQERQHLFFLRKSHLAESRFTNKKVQKKWELVVHSESTHSGKTWVSTIECGNHMDG